MQRNIAEIAEHMLRIHNLDISVYEESFLEKTIRRRSEKLGILFADEYARYLEQHREEAGLLYESLNIIYSEFFRNPLTFAMLEKIILPLLFDRKKGSEIRIWSMACAEGQEAYSIAILAHELMESSEYSPGVHIFATDLSPENIKIAANGRYHPRNVYHVPVKRLEKYFTREDNLYHVSPFLKKFVDFSVFNLLNTEISCPPASIFGNFDMIVCCNVLLYYKSGYRKVILDKIRRNLVPGGFVVTGEAEKEFFPHDHFVTRNINSAILQKS